MPDLIEAVSNGIAVLTMNRPDTRNALSEAMLDALNEALPRLNADSKIGVIVLTGAGGAFCSGGDVKSFAESAGGANYGRSLDEARLQSRRWMEVSRWLHHGPKISIAAIGGAAAGAGLSLALACDFRIAAATAKLTTAFIKVGLAGDFGGTYFMTQLLGPAKTRELYFLADIITGAEAEKIGLVNKAAPTESVVEEAMTLARRLADGPRISLGLMKQNLNVAERGDLLLSLDAEADNHARSAETGDHAEAARAFVEKRAPIFKNG
jgi:2-(1,2-epoxy-1,2-dihydrophenyl)acetyl-CoA isomerase